MARKSNLAYEANKYNTYKNERKKITSRKVGAGYFNYLYPNNVSKVRALAYRSRYDDDDEIGYLFGDMEESWHLDFFNLGFYLQSIAADLTDMYIRAFRLMLENMKRKPKEDESQFAEAFNDNDYLTDKGFNTSKGFKTSKRYKKFDLSFSKDNKGQNEIIKESSAKPIERSSSTFIDKGSKRSADLGVQNSAEALRGRGGCKNNDWGDCDAFNTFFEEDMGGYFEMA